MKSQHIAILIFLDTYDSIAMFLTISGFDEVFGLIYFHLNSLCCVRKYWFNSIINRGHKLEQSYAFQQFSANVEEEESWITEKQHLLSTGDLGDTMAAVQVSAHPWKIYELAKKYSQYIWIEGGINSLYYQCLQIYAKGNDHGLLI